MFIQACLLAVGPFHQAIAFALPLVDEAYAETEEGKTVVTSLFHADPDDPEIEAVMESLAEACGCEMWAPETHNINKQNIDWDMLEEILEHDVMALKELIKYGFMIIYVPPTIEAEEGTTEHETEEAIE